MEMSDDLGPRALAAALPGRPVRSYRAVVSTEADALAWARAGAPHGAVVVADYQAAPHGRSGLEWRVTPGRDLGFSIVLRPHLAVEREGWLYTVATVALADACGEGAAIAWPDEVRSGAARVAAVGVHAEPGPRALEWAVANVLVADIAGRRAGMLAEVATAIERRCAAPSADVAADHRARCETLGRRVRAGLLPQGPNAQAVTGAAVSTLLDGALVIATDDGRRVAVRPGGVSVVDPA